MSRAEALFSVRLTVTAARQAAAIHPNQANDLNKLFLKYISVSIWLSNSFWLLRYSHLKFTYRKNVVYTSFRCEPSTPPISSFKTNPLVGSRFYGYLRHLQSFKTIGGVLGVPQEQIITVVNTKTPNSKKRNAGAYNSTTHLNWDKPR